MLFWCYVCFVYKQNTPYEMRISDGSSDVCSSDLFLARAKSAGLARGLKAITRDRILDAITFDHTCVSDRSGANGEGGAVALSQWYSPRTLAQLRYLWQLLEMEIDQQRLVLELAFSALLFSCASSSGCLTASGTRRRDRKRLV